MKKILIVEDDILAAELERDYLLSAGFEVEICSNGTDGLSKALKADYDLLLLDVMLPGVSGFDICREVRQKFNLPIILLTAKTESVDKIKGLGLGADDYIVKPFDPSELLARVQAHLLIHERLLRDNQKDVQGEELLAYKDLVINVPARKVIVCGQEVELKNREYELLYYLASHPGIVFSKDTLFDRIWGMDAIGETATVMVHIGRIREKIEKNPQKPEYILTVWGAGYKFTDRQNI